MFQELMPLLSQRVLMLTLSRVTDEELCVNVIPKPLKSDQQSDDNALTTPLTVTGTPKELDEQLPRHLVEFVETHMELSSTLKTAKEQMDHAAKAAREAAKKSTPKSHHPFNKSAPTESAQVETKPDVQANSEGQSSSGTVQTIVDRAVAPGDGASTGSLFEVEMKADI